ncbi:hypothetical protein KEM54_000686 [Ascosphaera aggregata]|nr:hypothetical protein KEM54_000686 [Ascosphaera aggregata]
MSRYQIKDRQGLGIRGCVTPRQIAGIKETIGEDHDFDLLDGFDEISEENQIKIKQAVEQGHVADEDWRGDVDEEKTTDQPPKKAAEGKHGKRPASEVSNDEGVGQQEDAKNVALKKSDQGEEAAPVTKKAKMTKVKKATAKEHGGKDAAETKTKDIHRQEEEEEEGKETKKKGRKGKAVEKLSKEEAGKTADSKDDKKTSRKRTFAKRVNTRDNEEELTAGDGKDQRETDKIESDEITEKGYDQESSHQKDNAGKLDKTRKGKKTESEKKEKPRSKSKDTMPGKEPRRSGRNKKE